MSLMETVANYAFNIPGDERVKKWPLMGGPGLLILVLLIYALLVKKFIPDLMKNREAFQITGIITVYNTAQVVLCSYLVYQTVKAIKNIENYPIITCAIINYSTDPQQIRLAELCWWYLMLKLVDLIETIFFVLRKKFNQVSYLHLYHHISTPLFSWAMVKYTAGGSPTMYVAINSAIHILMYMYYLFTSIGLSKPLAPWKRYLTLIQMIQFCAIIIHASQAFIYECSIPKLLPVLFIPNVAFVYYMFSNFYEKTYNKNK